ncbi:MAG TPA: MFS transporter [Roseiflexaceae bacterium]|nr:MFS transporter [Roseiflexaceae bacterium]
MEAPETERAGQLNTGAPERELHLAEGVALAIGSAPDNDLGMGNPLLAPHHARIERVGGRLRLTDLAGADVLVNDTPIGGAAWLAPGDIVRIGRLRLTVGADAVRYRDPAGSLLIGRRRARALPDALINNMVGFDGVPIEPAQPLPNPADIARPAVFAVLRRRNFTLLWVAQLISELGSGFTLAAAAVLVYRLTGSALNVGLLMIATAVPSLFVGPVAGVFVDRWDRRRTMIVADLLRLGLLAALPFAISFSIAWLYAIVILTKVISKFFWPAQASLLPETAPEDELVAANALIAISTFGARAFGFAASGLIMSFFSIEWAFYLDALTFAVSAGCIFLIRSAPFAAASQAGVAAVARELRAGVGFLTSIPALRSLFLIYLPVFTMTGFGATILLPFTLRALHGTEFDYGVLAGMESVGLVAGSLLMARLAEMLREGQWIALSFIGMGLAAIAFSQVLTVPVAIAILMLGGVLSAPSVVARQLVIQQHTPRDMRGRVNSAFIVTRDTVFMIGMAATGLADLYSPRLLYLGSALVILACGWLTLALPGLRQPLTEWRQVFRMRRMMPHSSQESN